VSDNILGDLAIAVATDVQAAARALGIGSWGTAGPDVHEVVELDHPAPAHASFANGNYSGATHEAAHPGRMGGEITPVMIVVHTTDMLPGEFRALMTAWTTKPGDGACAHFVIDRDGTIYQLVPINRNGNHAGGPGHGVVMIKGKNVHPNLVAVGIEVHCAGGVHLIAGEWRLVEGGVAHGAPVPATEVTPDPIRPGRGWHQMAPAQVTSLRTLVVDIRGALAPVTDGPNAKSTGQAVPAWAEAARTDRDRVVGHVNLDPEHRSDPWPPAYSSGLMAELND
jgi:hypothetical protein